MGQESESRDAERRRSTPGAASGWATEDFFASTSHLIRTPLNGVIGMTELLLESELNPRQRMYAETALQSGERLLRVVEDVLDYSKLRTQTTQLEASDFELRRLLREAVNPFLALADDRGLFLHYSVGRDVPDTLRGDAERLRQILVNLLRTAIESTGEGEVYFRVVPLEDSEEAATLRFEVIDTAPGLPPEVREELFSRPVVPTGGSVCTGLELPISRHLAELMGGEVGIESEPEGNVYFFEARLQKGLGTSGYTLAPRFDLRGLRALVVEGDLASRELLREQAASWEMVADHAEEGPGVLALLHDAAGGRAPYDLVLMDLDLRRAEALELVRAVREHPAAADAQLVLLSSLGEDELGLRAAEEGVAAMLTKPVPQARLYETLTAVMGSRPGAPMPAAEDEVVPAGRDADETAGQREAHLLVVEDDPTNQLVAVRMLETLGHTYEVAANGREAVEAFSRGDYSAVLMDIQMPEVDGYEATAEIRGLEGPESRRTPIIAMTANAMRGDRERALAAGMDDYIPKPVKLAELEAMISRWTSGTEEVGGTPSAPEASAGERDPLDHAALADLHELQVEGEPDIFEELANTFLWEAPPRLAELRGAVSRGDGAAVERTAHALKGSCGRIGAVRMVPICDELERMGRSGGLRAASERLARLEDEYARARTALEAELSRS